MCAKKRVLPTDETVSWSDAAPNLESADRDDLPATDPILRLLANHQPFRQLPPEIRQKLAGELVWRRYAAGQTVYHQGDAADGLLIILSGSAEVVLLSDGAKEQVLNQVGEGAVLGEVALLATNRRSADVRALDDLLCLHWPLDRFQAMAASHPPLMSLLSSLVAERIGSAQIDSLCGKRLGDYRIIERLGRGGMGVVYLSEQLSSGRRTALKMMSYAKLFDHVSAARFRREADLLVGIRHPHIVTVYEQFLAFNTQFFAMEYCAGVSLSQLLREVGPLTESQARPLLGQLAAGLRHLHQHDVIHRDLKPANVLVFPDGTLKLADFGLARSSDQTDLTGVGHVVGTPLYMAIEQLQGQPADAAADVFAFGCIAYEMLFGQPPCLAGNLATLTRDRMRWRLPALHDLPAELTTEAYAHLQSLLGPRPGRQPACLDQIAAWRGSMDDDLLAYVAAARSADC